MKYCKLCTMQLKKKKRNLTQIILTSFKTLWFIKMQIFY